MFDSLNYLAIIVAAIANMAIGIVWYGPLFGKYWMRLMGFTKEGMKEMALPPAMAMVGGLITSLLVAVGLSTFASLWGAVSLGGALTFAFFVWLFFSVTTIASGFLWEGKSFQLYVLNIGYSLVAYGVVATIVVLWQ